MGVSTERFINGDDIKSSLCPICKDVFENPVQCRCPEEHDFCKGCIAQWLAINEGCPLNTCNALAVAQLKPSSKYLERQLSQLKVRCKFESRGCLVVRDLGDMAKHEAKCAHGVDKTFSLLSLINTENKIGLLQESNEELRRNNDALLKENDNLWCTISAHRQDNEILQAKPDQKNVAVHWSSELKTTKSELADVQEANRKLRSELNVSKLQNAKDQELLINFEALFVKKDDLLAAKELELRSAHRGSRKVKSELDKKNIRLEELSSEKLSLQNIAKTQNSELFAAQKRGDELSKALSKASTELDSTKRELDVLNEDNRKLRSDLSCSQLQIKKDQASITKLHRFVVANTLDIQSAKEENLKIQSELEQKNVLLKALSSEKTELQASLKLAKSNTEELISVRMKLFELTNAKRDLTVELESSKSEVDEVQENNRKLAAELNVSKFKIEKGKDAFLIVKSELELTKCELENANNLLDGILGTIKNRRRIVSQKIDSEPVSQDTAVSQDSLVENAPDDKKEEWTVVKKSRKERRAWNRLLRAAQRSSSEIIEEPSRPYFYG